MGRLRRSRSILQVVRPQRVQLRQRLLRQHVAVQRRLYERPPLRGVLLCSAWSASQSCRAALRSDPRPHPTWQGSAHRCFRHLEGRHFHLPLRQEAAIPGAHFPARGQKLGFVVHRRRGPQQHLPPADRRASAIDAKNPPSGETGAQSLLGGGRGEGAGDGSNLLGGVQAEVAIHDAPRRRRLRFARLE